MNRYSIIIPTLNEEIQLPKTLKNIREIFADAEVIVADGGSTDSTIEIAEKYKTRVVKSNPGRGIQINTGIKQAGGNILLIVHADTHLPNSAKNDIDRLFSASSVNVATFRLRFDLKHPVLKIYSMFTKFDSLFTTFGDQGIVVRSNFIKNTVGIKDLRIFEDVDFLRRSRKYTRVHKIPSFVTTSARRFEKQGIVKTQLLNLLYILKYIITQNTDSIYKDYFRMNTTNKNAVIVFVKMPAAGKVKTRLSKSTGSYLALELYKMFVKRIMNELEIMSKSNYDIYVFYEDAENQSGIKEWIEKEFYFVRQEGIELGERMSAAFNSIFAKGYSRAAIIGSDIPDITAGYIEGAFKKLDLNDAVISPSNDGGYNLLGLKKHSPELFAGIDWSTERVLDQTTAKFKSGGITFEAIDVLIDIDDERDLILWLKNGSNKALQNDIEQLIEKEKE